MKLIEEFKAKEKAAKKHLKQKIAALKAKAAKDTEENRKALVVELQKVRATLEKEEKHNEARAVAARIRSITSPVPRAAVNALGNMTGYISNAANLDKPFIFRRGWTPRGARFGALVPTLRIQISTKRPSMLASWATANRD